MDIEEYNRLKELLSKINEDYGKLVCVRKILVDRLRYYKDVTKEWREYRNRWILKYPTKQPKPLEDDNLKKFQISDTRDARSSSAPTPPRVPEGFAPSVSDMSRSTTPRIGLSTAYEQNPSPTRSVREESKALPDHAVVAQSATNNGHRASSTDVTEASEESDLSNNQSRTDPPQQAGPPHDDSESPVIISERSLKRKRHEDNGSSKHLPVKAEPVSSSPLPVVSSLRFEGPHESLDLDDVSGHVVTPKKRRMMQMQLAASKMSPAVFQEQELDDSNNQDLQEDPEVKGEDGKVGVTEDGALHSKEASDSRNISDENQRQRLRRLLHREPQQAHNDRVCQRLEDVERASPEVTYSKKSRNTRLQNQAGVEPHESPVKSGHPTPATRDNGQPHTPAVRRQMELHVGNLASPVLRPTDPNAQIRPRTNDVLGNRKPACPPSRQDRGAAAIPALAEDGDESAYVAKKAKANSDDSAAPEKFTKVPGAHHRLGALLGDSSPAKSLLESKENLPAIVKDSSTPITRSNIRSSKFPTKTPLTMPARRSMPDSPEKNAPATEGKGIGTLMYEKMISKNRNPTPNPTPKPTFCKPPPKEPPPETKPEHEPLRSRPIARLNLDDFKLNPTHSDYAYHESIRKHDEKNSVSGCTDKNCLRCKDIRKFVENSNYAHQPGEDTAKTDRLLIENFLGKDKGRLKKMSAEEKKEILIQAKTQQFADKFGKHRTRFGRALSPVDYWNMEFPSTQEETRNRELTRVREREKVEERYWEAVRKGGRWIFADEV